MKSRIYFGIFFYTFTAKQFQQLDQLIHIGKIVATFGINGQVIATHVLGKKITFKPQDALFVEVTKAKPIPFFVENCTAKNDTEINIQLEGIGSKEAAMHLIGKNIWVNEANFNALVDKNAPIALIGYMVIDGGKTLGSIEEMIEQPHQLLAKIMIDNKEVLIPLNQSTLVEINRKKKTISVNLPNGLLDIYLQ